MIPINYKMIIRQPMHVIMITKFVMYRLGIQGLNYKTKQSKTVVKLIKIHI